MVSDIEDYLAWLRDKRGKAAQTLSTYRRLLRRFEAAHSGRDLRLLDDETLQHYLVNHLGSGNRSPATLRMHRSVLRGFYEWLYRQRILSANPALELELPCQPQPAAPRTLTLAQITTLLEPPETDPELGPLDAPVEVLFNVGAIGWALDTRRGAIQLEFYPDDQDVQEVAAIVQVWLYPGVAKQFAARARIIVATADPSCPFCSQPVHAAGHICPRSNGYRAPLF